MLNYEHTKARLYNEDTILVDLYSIHISVNLGCTSRIPESKQNHKRRSVKKKIMVVFKKLGDS